MKKRITLYNTNTPSRTLTVEKSQIKPTTLLVHVLGAEGIRLSARQVSQLQTTLTSWLCELGPLTTPRPEWVEE